MTHASHLTTIKVRKSEPRLRLYQIVWSQNLTWIILNFPNEPFQVTVSVSLLHKEYVHYSAFNPPERGDVQMDETGKLT